MEFKVGDRIKVIDPPTPGIKVEFVGTILEIDKTSGPHILVEFDAYIAGHDGDIGKGPLGKDKHCWWMKPSEIEVIR